MRKNKFDRKCGGKYDHAIMQNRAKEGDHRDKKGCKESNDKKIKALHRLIDSFYFA